MVEPTDNKSFLRAGMPAMLYGAAFFVMGYVVGTWYNTISATPSALVFGAGAALFAVAVKLTDNL